jgi:hypothetical protein
MKRFGTSWFVVGSCLSLIGCGSSALPRELFTIEAIGADYPVMLSRTGARTGGRKLEAHSGTSKSETHYGYSTASTSVSVRLREREESELSASTKLAAQVRRSDRWVQLERAVFTAVDSIKAAETRSVRELSLEGTARR